MKAPKTLTELIDAAAVRHDASVRQLASLAQSKGYKITHTTLNAMRAGSYKSTPKAETLKGIAWLAGVSERVAFTAAGQPVPGPPIADELPDGADRLSAKSRRVLIEMARVLVDLEARTDDTNTEDDHAGGPRAVGHEAGAGGERVVDGAGVGAAEKTVPPIELLAAHPPMERARDKFETAYGAVGEENQDPEGDE
ncbi:MAG: hypothetical protein ACTII7_07640 [Galactobacter sp.]